MKALIALSGGIDSAVAACLLREAGHEIVGGVTMTRGDAAQGAPRFGGVFLRNFSDPLYSAQKM